jgi:hypothetical protein
VSLAQILSQNLRASGIPKRFQPLLGQAGTEALVRFGPQYDQLNQLREQSALQMRQAQAQATSAAQLIAALAGQQRSAIQSDTTNPAIQQALAYQKAPEGSSTQRVGLGLALGRDATSNILSQVAVNAPIAAAQQGQQASAAHLQDLQRINAQRASLLGEAGNYITGRTQDLIGADRKQRSQLNQNLRTVRTRLQTAQLSADTQRRGQDITARGQDIASADRQAAIDQRRAAANKPGGAKSQFLNPNQQTKTVGRIKGAQQGIKQLAGRKSQKTGKPISRDQIETLLRAGQIDGVKYTQPEIDVAMDLYHNQGKLSSRGVRVLHGTLRTQAHGNFGLAPRLPRRRQPAVGPPAPAGPAGSLG